ncbi:VOC family protein [Aquisalibacillus elongatus]|uniref:Catechol 2,3-dioxygenase-like lactoylglutathione lyase family enzyme n=1 Tax=Aquisalibacillus elongatus TaxID=485577 RepID=A0A3N5BA99_9BACI|nr:VOC family protein [Aquisalibacillus elongatus]RPF54307.1 catechol 2,3-dioxygenase-like lactoylglutathione lyase family enzyme [Aquisalibacillus elongatus]
MFKIGGIFIPVTDLEKSQKWYEQNLGVKKFDEWQEDGEDHGVDYLFQNDTTGLTLIKVDKPQATEFTIKGNRKNAYYNFEVDDIYDAFNHLKNNGVELTDIHDYGPMKGFDFFDLDGNPFSVISEEE